MTELWGDKRYNSLNDFLRNKFGTKVFKISLDGGFTCPNRDGKISTGGCIFCSERGSGDFTGTDGDLNEQFDQGIKRMSGKWKSTKYIAYFQAYTNTYAPVNELRAKFYSMIDRKDVCGIAIATRPDCLNDEVLDLLSELNKKTYLWIELGFQTSNENTAIMINRGYKNSTYNDAVKELTKRGIEYVTHIILGLPWENKKDMLETVKYVSDKNPSGIKLQLLHLMKNTRLEEIYNQKHFKLLELDEYVDIVIAALEIIPPNVVIHRLTGDSPWKLLIGPTWSTDKWTVLNTINNKLKATNTWQGRLSK